MGDLKKKIVNMGAILTPPKKSWNMGQLCKKSGKIHGEIFFKNVYIVWTKANKIAQQT